MHTNFLISVAKLPNRRPLWLGAPRHVTPRPRRAALFTFAGSSDPRWDCERQRGALALLFILSLSLSPSCWREKCLFLQTREEGFFRLFEGVILKRFFWNFFPVFEKVWWFFLYEVFFSSFVSACCWVLCSAKTREMVFVLWWRLLEIGSKMDRICFGCVGGV